MSFAKHLMNCVYLKAYLLDALLQYGSKSFRVLAARIHTAESYNAIIARCMNNLKEERDIVPSRLLLTSFLLKCHFCIHIAESIFGQSKA